MQEDEQGPALESRHIGLPRCALHQQSLLARDSESHGQIRIRHLEILRAWPSQEAFDYEDREEDNAARLPDRLRNPWELHRNRRTQRYQGFLRR